MVLTNEQNVQKQFEQYIEILIAYKKCNLDKDVYLNMNSLDDALKWYHTISKEISPDLINKLMNQDK